MNIPLPKALTIADYIAWGTAQPERLRAELINGQIVAMTPERVEHVEVKVAATIALKSAIQRAGVSCHALGDGMTVRIDDHTAYEPDALVYCGERLARGSLIVPDPIIVVEVLSPATMHTDTSAKLIGYFKVATVRHYLVIDPATRMVTHHARASDGIVVARSVSEDMLHLDPPGIELSVAGLFG